MKDSVNIRENISIPESQDAVAFVFQPPRTYIIFSPDTVFIMLPAIKFHD
jgi:hypothetical protein